MTDPLAELSQQLKASMEESGSLPDSLGDEHFKVQEPQVANEVIARPDANDGEKAEALSQEKEEPSQEPLDVEDTSAVRTKGAQREIKKLRQRAQEAESQVEEFQSKMAELDAIKAQLQHTQQESQSFRQQWQQAQEQYQAAMEQWQRSQAELQMQEQLETMDPEERRLFELEKKIERWGQSQEEFIRQQQIKEQQQAEQNRFQATVQAFENYGNAAMKQAGIEGDAFLVDKFWDTAEKVVGNLEREGYLKLGQPVPPKLMTEIAARVKAEDDARFRARQEQASKAEQERQGKLNAIPSPAGAAGSAPAAVGSDALPSWDEGKDLNELDALLRDAVDKGSLEALLNSR